MNELLIVFLLLLISAAMFSLILLILKADRKVLELNNQVTKVKNTDFSNLKKVVAFFNTINKNIKLGKIKYYIEVVLTAISAFNIVLLFKKIYNKYKREK